MTGIRHPMKSPLGAPKAWRAAAVKRGTLRSTSSKVRSEDHSRHTKQRVYRRSSISISRNFLSDVVLRCLLPSWRKSRSIRTGMQQRTYPDLKRYCISASYNQRRNFWARAFQNLACGPNPNLFQPRHIRQPRNAISRRRELPHAGSQRAEDKIPHRQTLTAQNRIPCHLKRHRMSLDRTETFSFYLTEYRLGRKQDSKNILSRLNPEPCRFPFL